MSAANEEEQFAGDSGHAWLAALAIFGLYCIVAGLSGMLVIDDAFITFRYARNLADHGELVFNPGERVEGITNLLWTLMLAGLYRASGVPFPQAAVLLSMALMCWGFVRMHATALLITGNRIAAVLVVCLLAANPNFVLTTTNGLEATLFVVLLAELGYRVCRAHWTMAGATAGLLFLTRPDGGAMILPVALAAWINTRDPRAAWRAFIAMLPFVVLASAFRWSYYGALLPNSVLAKAYPLSEVGTLARGFARYTLDFILANGYLLLPLGFIAFHWKRIRELPAAGTGLLAFATLALLAAAVIILRNGGDWMPHSRFYLQYGPIWVLVAALAVQLAPALSSWTAALLLWPAALVALSLQNNRVAVFTIHPVSEPFYAEVAQRLDGKLRGDDVVSAEAVGYISYVLSDTRVHDPLGLTDAHLARHGQPIARFGKRDSQYTLGVVKPAIAVWHTVDHLWSLPQQIRDQYEVRQSGQDGGWKTNQVYIRRDRVESLSPLFADWPVVDGRFHAPAR